MKMAVVLMAQLPIAHGILHISVLPLSRRSQERVKTSTANNVLL
jgi:hypothetical protein